VPASPPQQIIPPNIAATATTRAASLARALGVAPRLTAAHHNVVDTDR